MAVPSAMRATRSAKNAHWSSSALRRFRQRSSRGMLFGNKPDMPLQHYRYQQRIIIAQVIGNDQQRTRCGNILATNDPVATGKVLTTKKIAQPGQETIAPTIAPLMYLLLFQYSRNITRYRRTDSTPGNILASKLVALPVSPSSSKLTAFWLSINTTRALYKLTSGKPSCWPFRTTGNNCNARGRDA